MEAEQVNESVRGQAEILQHISAYVTSMALKCAVDLRIADIIHSHGGGPITLSQIASAIAGSSCPSISYLERIMRLLVHKNIFTAQYHPSDGGETLYGLTSSSRWILWDSKPNLAPYVLMQNQQSAISPFLSLSQCVKDGGLGFEKVYGCKIWEFAAANPEFNKLFNDAMSSMVDILMGVFLPAYKDGFSSIRSLVDVGGGIGTTLSEIVKSHPHIRGINFDLPHVIATAPVNERITHIGGNMFEAVPTGDAIIMKGVLHDWSDEMCVKILKNCRKAIPENSGKLIIVEMILELQESDIFEEAKITLDLVMMMSNSGKERTEVEWKKLLKEGGFPRCRIIKIQARQSIIEAYPI
ncbi:hypothetical protein FNV43_RR13566 [Rhamnella rubrinervis]|uniref:Uncharacterized protein n=1 Tax=Rhamnella rubrinervis TaxID=2594499 RepID=A0A8K0H1A8_9ROSA|nr:hypothetical protein FNV43_RR13566 [Rhamnella rubrinervis]